MTIISSIQHGDAKQRVEAGAGLSLMHVAQAGQVPGILGDCGGSCSGASQWRTVNAGLCPARTAEQSVGLPSDPQRGAE